MEAAYQARWRAPRCVPRSEQPLLPPQAAHGQENVASETIYAGIHPIQTLENSGIPAADIKKLVEAGVHTVEALAHASSKMLVAIKGLSDVKVLKLKQCGACASARASGVPLRRCSRPRVPSGGHCASGLHHRKHGAAEDGAHHPHHHRLRGAGPTAGRCAEGRARESTRVVPNARPEARTRTGGVESGSLTEIYGEFRTGKTQICHMLAVTSQARRRDSCRSAFKAHASRTSSPSTRAAARARRCISTRKALSGQTGWSPSQSGARTQTSQRRSAAPAPARALLLRSQAGLASWQARLSALLRWF
jgi:hypothetical protein